jgi:CBS domain-containing protein
MEVRDMMHTHVITVAPTSSMSQAQRLMQEHRIRHLPVLSGRRLVGLITDRDLRHALPSLATTLSRGEINYQMDTTPIETFMTREVVVIRPQDSIMEGASQLLKGPFGCLPVLADGELVGIITEIDLLRGFLAAAVPAGALMQVKDYMQTEPYTIMPNDLVSIAFERMYESHIRHLPVVASGLKLVGILTDRDIRLASASTAPHLAAHELVGLLEKMTVNSIMTTEVQTVRQDTAVADAGQRFIDHKFSCLPVVGEDDILQGIITVTDLLRAYVAQHQNETSSCT